MRLAPSGPASDEVGSRNTGPATARCCALGGSEGGLAKQNEVQLSVKVFRGAAVPNLRDGVPSDRAVFFEELDDFIVLETDRIAQRRTAPAIAGVQVDSLRDEVA